MLFKLICTTKPCEASVLRGFHLTKREAEVPHLLWLGAEAWQGGGVGGVPALEGPSLRADGERAGFS